MTKKEWKEFLQWSKKNWSNVLLFLALWLILGLGIYQLLFFVPSPMLLGIDKILSSEPSMDENEVRFSISLCVSCGLNALFFYLYFKQKKDLELLKDALRVLTYLDPKGFYHPKGLGLLGGWCGGEYMPRLRDNSLDEFDQNKDIALGLILEADGVLAKFSHSDKGFVGDFDLNDNREKIAKIVVKLNKREGLFKQLTILNELILDNIEDWIKQHFPKEVYFLRLNLLNYFIQASDQVKFLVFDKPKGLSNEKILFVETKEGSLDCKDNIVKEFFKVVLNKYYSKFQDYEMQPVNFDHRLFRKCFTVEGAVWGFLREAYWLLWNAYEYDGHRKNPPAIGELLSNVYQIYENKELSNANVSVVLWNAYEALSNANKIYEVNVKELPTSARFDLDFEIYAKKELSSGAGELMLPYLEEAEKFLIEAENLLRFSEVEHWEFCDSPIPIVKN
jgi:hypothetical protein